MTGPGASSPTIQSRMQRQRRKDTKPELALRKALFAMGLRYRVDRAVGPGTRRRADIVFGPARVAVFVDGCFWHSCPLHRTQPKANATWWTEKLAGNVQRDRETDRRLGELGWLVLRVWEHEAPQAAAERIRHAVSVRKHAQLGT